MKKIIPFLLIPFFVFACGREDKNIALVKKEFKSYAKKNFDNPKKLIETVEITPSDTFSYSTTKKEVAVMDSVIKAFTIVQNFNDSLSITEFDKHYETFKRLERARKISYVDYFSVYLIEMKFPTITSQKNAEKEYLARQNASLVKLCNRLKYKPAIYSYDIKYSKQYPDGAKLETMYAYVDSLSGVKAILNEKNVSEMISPEYNEIFEKINDCLVSLNDLQKLNQKAEDLTDQLIDIIRYSENKN